MTSPTTRGPGQPQKPYLTSWGEAIAGLGRTSDGRWRIIATGKRFTEANERAAIQKFFKMGGAKELTIHVGKKPVKIMVNAREAAAYLDQIIAENDKPFWERVARELRERPKYCAEKTGIEELGYLRELRPPAGALSLQDVIAAYRDLSASKSKLRTIQIFEGMMGRVNAKLLSDVNTEKMLTLKNSIESDPSITSGDTKSWMYGQLKSVISFGLKAGLDKAPIHSALDACAVLWSAQKKTESKPMSIRPEDFHKLLKAGNGSWRPWLLLGLNCCLHLGEVLKLKWTDFDLKAGTYSAIREKTGVARAAVLWPETIEALKKIKRTGSSYVFISSHGTTFNRNSRSNAFADLRKIAGVTAELEFEWIRDGAYTAAIRDKGTDEKESRVFAGHRSPGDQDDYVLRNPIMTAAPCAAVYRHYFGKEFGA